VFCSWTNLPEFPYIIVEIKVNTICRCFLADAPRRTRHLPGCLVGSSPERTEAQTLHGGGGTDRKRKADAPRRARHLSGRLIGSSLGDVP